ncbi:NF-kappa-B inhibitor zeta isoform X2 [Syngnathoides biaculeatus]|uniref:NF-kappa-B inhibitor zeta isoform X2 n=1 Tax=Syngnathoides biaculeatus TaxID=300417 RepID=UPI002ADD77BC|nr:NF-kappa-B inhibitor zeta isoform X2 [Syngnathoides biaculeatus]XP_061687176.1 NF-kappa-B inhibitor zeta isoform X2 [Syngnathoides biaculeatus]
MSHQVSQKRKLSLEENPENATDQLSYAYLPGYQPHTTPECTLTLFQWQIEQEARRYDGVAPELLSSQDVDGDTCLHIAVAQGRRALAYLLGSKMADCGALEVKDRHGQTPLQIAAVANQHLIVDDLLAHGANINTRDSWGRSPLHVCAAKGFYLCLQSIWTTFSGRLQMIDTEVFNYEGLTALHLAVLSHNALENEWRRRPDTCTRDQDQDQYQQRKQMYALCVEALLNMGASCGTADLKSGRTCLHMAAEEANHQLLTIFLKQPSGLSSLNNKTFSGNTALHVVSSLQNHPAQLEVLKMLMRWGADPTARNLENERPWHLVPEGPPGASATERKAQRCLKVLKNRTLSVRQSNVNICLHDADVGRFSETNHCDVILNEQM